MPYGIYLSAAGADAQAQRMEIISNNMANVDTVGFRAEMAVLRARQSEDILQGQAMAGDGSVPNVGGGGYLYPNTERLGDSMVRLIATRQALLRLGKTRIQPNVERAYFRYAIGSAWHRWCVTEYLPCARAVRGDWNLVVRLSDRCRVPVCWRLACQGLGGRAREPNSLHAFRNDFVWANACGGE